MTQGRGMKRYEARRAAVDGAFDHAATNRIDAIKDKEFQFRFARRLHAVAHSGRVSVEAAADVLDIEDESVEVFQLFGSGRAAFAVKAVYGQAGLFIDAVSKFLVELTANAVLGTEQGLELDAFGGFENVDGGIAVAIDAGVVGDQADAQVLQWCELLLDEDVDPVEHFAGARVRAVGSGGRCSGALWQCTR